MMTSTNRHALSVKNRRNVRRVNVFYVERNDSDFVFRLAAVKLDVRNFFQLGNRVSRQLSFNAFNLCENLQRFIVDAQNPAYASPDGALCSKALKTLVVYPRARTDARLPDSLVAAMPDAFAGCNKLWMEWCKRINTISYDLTQTPGDKAIADVTVNGDMALDAFVLKEGKVYDSVLYVCNNANHAVKVTLPSLPLTEYKTFKGATPLTLPAYSTSILTITRVAGGNAGGNVFLVTREELETVK